MILTGPLYTIVGKELDYHYFTSLLVALEIPSCLYTPNNQSIQIKYRLDHYAYIHPYARTNTYVYV